MPQTLSVIKAGVGGFGGQGTTHPDVLEAARATLAQGATRSAGSGKGCGAAWVLAFTVGG